jgi:hypothetical protein
MTINSKASKMSTTKGTNKVIPCDFLVNIELYPRMVDGVVNHPDSNYFPTQKILSTKMVQY